MSYIRATVANRKLQSLIAVAGPTHAREVVSQVAKRHGLSVTALTAVFGKTHPHGPVVAEAIRSALRLKFSKADIGRVLKRKIASLNWFLDRYPEQNSAQSGADRSGVSLGERGSTGAGASSSIASP